MMIRVDDIRVLNELEQRCLYDSDTVIVIAGRHKS